MKDNKFVEMIIGAILTTVCTLSAYYLHTMNENLSDVKRAYELDTYRIGVLESASLEYKASIRECQTSIEVLRRQCKKG